MTLKQLRKALAISNKEMASRLYMPPSRLSEYANGRRPIPFGLALRICRTFDVDASVDVGRKAYIFALKSS